MPTLPLLLILALGCGQRAPTTEAKSYPTKPAPYERKEMEERLAERLPPGRVVFRANHAEKDEGTLYYSVSWAKPGMPHNEAGFGVYRKGSRVRMELCGPGVKYAKWAFENGKLVEETASSDVLAAHWEWLQKRAHEIAEATYDACR